VTLKKLGLIHSEIAKLYGSLDEPNMMDNFATMSGTFEKLQKSCLALRDIASEKFGKFFQYNKFELGAVEELVASCKTMKSRVSQTEKKLREKKEQLFTQKQIAKWELDTKCKFTVDTLMNNKAIAFQEMVPNDTKEAGKQHIFYGYYCNKVLEEFVRSFWKSQW